MKRRRKNPPDSSFLWLALAAGALYLLSSKSAAATAGQTAAPTTGPVMGPANPYAGWVQCTDPNGNVYFTPTGPCPVVSFSPGGATSNAGMTMPGGASGSWDYSGSTVPQAVQDVINSVMNS